MQDTHITVARIGSKVIQYTKKKCGVSTKDMEISQAWWHKAEAGELLETRRQRLQLAKIMPLYSSLSDRVRLCLKKRKKKNIVSDLKNSFKNFNSRFV